VAVTSPGKTRRMRRVMDPSGHTVILPLDIVVPVGPFDGAQDTGALVDMASAVGVDAVILRWGEAKRFVDRLSGEVGLIVRVSGSTGLHNADRPPVVLNTVLASVSIGADAVCVDVELGGDRENESLSALARVCEDAEALGVVVLAEVHVPPAPATGGTSRAQALAWGTRTAREVGADLVKVSDPGSAEAVATICELAGIPIVIAGGAPRDPREALQAADDALRAGAAGTAFGRNVMGHPSPVDMQRALIDLVRGRDTLGDIVARLGTATPAMHDHQALR
jgi:2-amino-4,5-dihydroxy-6-oxo-7-(phosphonooxy)heptanoate synthase